ncbi:uncharacterized protein LOC131619669 [Vicia villosa]|uniref:uncharacterized protein LOC131619669 n=1 Tax=Vicia villosa TaxID=3911 RepID=UPI00273C3FFF|nr:uncharacterized protein LOC131619669 [Vicia villosa]
MGLGTIWLRWMEGCVFTSSMSIMVNGSTTKDFTVEKGLRQGDPLSPFLFVLVMEVLTALMNKAIDIGEFKRFKIKDGIEVNMLQFADDTVIVAEGDSENLWALKIIFRGFEMMSSLRVNFHKSNIYGINVGDCYLEATSLFLSCKVDVLPFKFLGVWVGDSPRKLSMWQELISNFNRRLAVWKGLHLNIAGQSKFLWNGGDARRLIHWVSWDIVSKPKEEGGLGVKNVEVMNIALLSKWKWRILMEDEPVWRAILDARYENVKWKVLIGDISVVEKNDSIWRRDILISNNYLLLQEPSFVAVVHCLVGDRYNVPFWYSCWEKGQVLIQAYPKLFALARKDNMIVAEAGSFTDGGWEWSTDSVFTDSSSIPNRLLEDLFDYITPVTQRLDVEDKFVWSSSGQQVFTVKSCYDTFKSKLSGPPLNTRMVKAFKHLWKVKAPPKILFFGWRIIHNNRLSTKDQLHKRGMSDVSRDLNCVFCLSEEECPSHLLGGCEVVSKVWKKVYEWMDYGEALTLEEFNEFFFVMEKVDVEMSHIWGNLSYFLRMEFKITKKGMLLHPRKYVKEMLKRIWMDDSNPASSYVESNMKLEKHEEEDNVDVTLLKQIIRYLRYVCNSIPDIGFSAGLVSRYMDEPNVSHMKVGRRIQGYLTGSTIPRYSRKQL